MPTQNELTEWKHQILEEYPKLAEIEVYLEYLLSAYASNPEVFKKQQRLLKKCQPCAAPQNSLQSYGITLATPEELEKYSAEVSEQDAIPSSTKAG